MRLITILYILFLLSCQSSEKKDMAPTHVSREDSLMALMQQHPDSLLLKEEWIQLLRDGNRYDKAIDEAARYAAEDSLNPRWWNILGTLQYENTDTLAAIRSFEKAVALSPQTGYLISLGILYAKINDARAERAATLLKTIEPKAQKEAFFILGLYKQKSGESARALAYFDSCLRVSYTFMEAYREKAITFYNMAKYKEAVTILEKAITVQNDYEEAYFYRGLCQEKMGLKAEAAASFKSALAYAPDYFEAREALDQLEK